MSPEPLDKRLAEIRKSLEENKKNLDRLVENVREIVGGDNLPESEKNGPAADGRRSPSRSKGRPRKSP